MMKEMTSDVTFATEKDILKNSAVLHAGSVMSQGTGTRTAPRKKKRGEARAEGEEETNQIREREDNLRKERILPMQRRKIIIKATKTTEQEMIVPMNLILIRIDQASQDQDQIQAPRQKRRLPQEEKIRKEDLSKADTTRITG